MKLQTFLPPKNLASISGTGRPGCIEILKEAINVNQSLYENHHVYPYTYKAGYKYRQGDYKADLVLGFFGRLSAMDLKGWQTSFNRFQYHLACKKTLGATLGP